MKPIVYFIAFVVIIFYISEAKINFNKPVFSSIELPQWRTALGILLIVIGILFAGLDQYRQGLKDSIQKLEKDLNIKQTIEIKEQYPDKEYQDLFDYIHHEHGVILLQSEVSDLIRIVHKFHPQAAAKWVNSEYDRLYDQLKADPEKRIVCWIDYNPFTGKEPYRDICYITGRGMQFGSRGHGYGEVNYIPGDKKTNFVGLCQENHVEWLDDSIQEKEDKA